MVPTCTGPLLCVQISGAQAAAELRKQSRVAACGAVRPQGGMERLFHIRKRALSIITRAQTHSPLALMAGPSQGTFRTVHSMHARSFYSIIEAYYYAFTGRVPMTRATVLEPRSSDLPAILAPVPACWTRGGRL